MKLFITRDSSGDLFLHAEKPRLLKDIYNEMWCSDNWVILKKESFPEVTFENSPMEVELKLIEK